MTALEIFMMVYLISAIINFGHTQFEVNKLKREKRINLGRGQYRMATKGDMQDKLLGGVFFGLFPILNVVIALISVIMFVERTDTYKRYKTWKEKPL